MCESTKFRKILKYWLIIGCVLLFFQIIIGGITRITGSGLSITKWEIVTGSLPPLNQTDWGEAFDLYKETPQYKKINAGMEISDFKFIYFWEYFHRLWARIMGLIFLIPFIIFYFKGYFDKKLLRLLGLVFFFAMMAAVFGWIMVASGLVDRPWVHAYKLSLHLGIALATLGFLLWATYYSFLTNSFVYTDKKIRKETIQLFVVVCIQIFFGAILSGARAALVFPTWPDIGGEYIPSVLFSVESWTMDNIMAYDKHLLIPSLIHFLHRTLGYLILIFGISWFVRVFKSPHFKELKLNSYILICVLCIQVLLGIITLLMSKGNIPVLWGVLHQGTAIFLFGIALYNVYVIRYK